MENCREWSTEFDLMYNNITSNKAPGLEEYEKSVFLTDAQEAVVVGLYKGTFGSAFEGTEEVTAYLGELVKQKNCNVVSEAQALLLYKLSSKSKIYVNPDDLLFRTWEGCKISVEDCGTMDAQVIPVTQDEYWRTVRNPFKKQNSRRVLRLSYDKGDTTYSELISDYPILSYTVRYLSRPEPIILEDLPEGLSIHGNTQACTCKLDKALHQSILSEAVRMAKAIWNT